MQPVCRAGSFASRGNMLAALSGRASAAPCLHHVEVASYPMLQTARSGTSFWSHSGQKSFADDPDSHVLSELPSSPWTNSTCAVGFLGIALGWTRVTKFAPARAYHAFQLQFELGDRLRQASVRHINSGARFKGGRLSFRGEEVCNRSRAGIGRSSTEERPHLIIRRSRHDIGGMRRRQPRDMFGRGRTSSAHSDHALATARHVLAIGAL